MRLSLLETGFATGAAGLHAADEKFCKLEYDFRSLL